MAGSEEFLRSYRCSRLCMDSKNKLAINSSNSPVYEIKARLSQLPTNARMAIAGFYGIAFGVALFGLFGKVPLEYAFLSLVAAIWFTYGLETITEWILHRLRYAVKIQRESIQIKRFNDANATAIPWSELEAVNLPSKHRFVKDSVILQFENDEDLRIAWDDIKSEIGELPFINVLHAWAPQAVIHGELPGLEMKPRTINYTELWLNDLGSTRVPQLTAFLPTGAKLKEGRYEIVQLLGQGGQGTTYLATDKRSGNEEIVLKEYIIPVNRGEILKKASERKLETVAKLLGRLHHPQIVKLMNNFVENGRGYVVLEYVSGKTLKQLVELQGPQPEGFVVGMAIQVCDILSYLHRLEPHVVHRDLSPDNLMLQDDGTIKVVDFDIAQELVSTRSITVAGKHRYIPPEQFRGQASAQSDIYALGCTMFYLLTGLEPEPMVISRPQQIVGTSVSDIVESIVAVATQLDPEQRFQSADDMKLRLTNARLMHGY